MKRKRVERADRAADRIRLLVQFYIDHKAIKNMKTFEDACGLSPRYVKNLSGTTHGNAGVDTIAKIYRTFGGVNLHWLVLGDGDMFTVSEENALRYARDATADAVKKSKIRSMLNSKAFKGMTREEKMDLVEQILNS